MTQLRIKQIHNADSPPNSYIAFNGSKNVWQKIRHTEDFALSELTDGKLAINHGLGRKYVQVAIYDDEGWQVRPDNVRLLSTDELEIYFTSFDEEDQTQVWVAVIS